MKVRKLFKRILMLYDLYHCLPMFFFMLFYLLWFRIIEYIPRSFYLQILLKIDRYIPLIECFVLPYLSWFFYMIYSMADLFVKDKDAYDKACTMLMIGMTVFLLISTVCPNRQPLRLVEFPRNNVFTRMIGRLWKTDTPTNVFPSIHVFNTLCVESMLLRTKCGKYRRTGIRITTVIWAALIVLSTLFIRQHSMFDVLTALALFAVCYYIVIFRGTVFYFRKWDSFARAAIDRL